MHSMFLKTGNKRNNVTNQNQNTTNALTKKDYYASNIVHAIQSPPLYMLQLNEINL